MQLSRYFSIRPMRPMLDFWLQNYKIMCVNPLNVWWFPIAALANKCTENIQFSSVQLLSCIRLFATPWTAACQASLSITNCRSLLKLMFIESVTPFSHLILCRPLLLLPPIHPSIRVFSNESTLCMRWPKYWSFHFSISPSNEYSGQISFRISLQSKGLSRAFSKITVQRHQFFGTQFSI